MRVLLVEDDPMIGRAVSAGLHGAGYVVDWVRDGEGAELAVGTGVYDLALLDLGLPRRDRLEIRKDQRQLVFERFHRVAGDSTAGSGLGLAIAKAIVERHHGSMELEDDAPGAAPTGLLVRVRLPPGSADRPHPD